MKEEVEDINRIPRLRVSEAKKRANDFAHTKAIINYYINASFFNADSIGVSGARDLSILYDAYNNRLPEEFFNYVKNPYNSKNQEYTNWPARVRSYSIIRPNIDLLKGEYEKRPFNNFVVKVNNPDAVNIQQDLQFKELLRSLEQQFINILNQRGQDTGQPTQDVELPENIKKKYSSNYRDYRAEMGEAALDIILDELKLEQRFKLLFMDWLIAGEVYTYKGVRGNQMIHERVSPFDIDYDKSPDEPFVEDAQWVVRRMYLTPSQIYDMFYEEMKESQIEMIESEHGDISFRSMATDSWRTFRDEEDMSRSKIPVFHVCFKYLTKIGILRYPNPITGEIEEIEVPDTYKPSEGEEVEWFWVNEVWEGYRVLDEMYFGIQPVPNQRNSLTNMSVCKLPYNGKRFSDLHSRNISPVELGLPYEILHRILHFQLERTIARSKGKIVLIDQNIIPKKNGWDEEKFIYFSEATGWGMVDRSQPGVDRSYNQYQVLDLGLYEHINNLIEVMEFIKHEWNELLGITRQRKGDTRPTDTATGVENAIYQSSVISEKIFSGFEEFVESELQGLLDVSKLAWSEGFQRLHTRDDLTTTVLQLDPVVYSEAEFGVFVSKSARDIQNMEMVRARIQEFAQNGVPPSAIVDIVQARSLNRLRNILKEAELKSMEAQQNIALQEQEAQERQLMIQGQFKELEGIIKERLIHAEYDRKEDIELLKLTGQDQNPDPIIDPSNAQKVISDDMNKQADRNLKARIEARKAQQKDRELDIKEKELKVRKEIADKQAKVALKNKVVGEK